jgi:L-threonylcarbamoyladenylate synthase
VRVPAHPLALALLRAYAQAGGGTGGRCGIAAPSANRFGRISPTEAAHVQQELGEAVALVLDGGPCAVGIESTILDLSRAPFFPPRLLRPGRISPEQIATVLGVLPEFPELAAPDTPRVSGSLAAHYAPATPLRIVAPERLIDFISVLRDSGRHAALLCHNPPPQAALPYVWRMLPAEPEGYARGFYATLRELDLAGSDLIVVEAIPASAPWFAIADRLRRAACGAGLDDPVYSRDLPEDPHG